LKYKLRNKFETKLSTQLKKSRLPFDYEIEKLKYILVKNYVPDFVVKTRTGRKLYIEAKGYLRPEHRVKLVAVKQQHPEKDIRIVFYAPNKKYERWAKKHGFLYAFSNIPKEWLNE
jgi:hypothetical protein